ncbi:hypothetical protein DLD77_09140 [Chitinophaga alhagiae]|uniref:MAE-28990/MAE-18760-like HEPN domain-containing protein n=1 Tax=Chitinophaga alhagiae TaxID=2203219 RepID=A0ABM6WCU5_9BACT|nr:hypothetical protein [Chitinophaga alhagiae]AWO01849.1 hypothetical protein DLD77_09140 [Chitinophaga alhagiae]
MLSQETLDYYQSWKRKQAANVEDDLSAVFNGFRDLYPTYNRLYNEIPTALKATGVVLPKRLEDNQKATKYVVQYIGASNLLTHLSKNNNDSDIESIDWILEEELFHIKLIQGQSDRNADIQLRAELNSTDAETKAIAILKVIYYVRCNMEHGEKHFEEHQRLLLQPLTNILVAVIEQLYELLSKP